MNEHQAITEAMQSTPNVFDFIQGQKDCRDGKAHASKSESYDQGYSLQYHIEQSKG